MAAASLGSLFRETKKSFFLRRNDFLVFILIGSVVFGALSAAMDIRERMFHQQLAQKLGVSEETAEDLYSQHKRSRFDESKNDPLLIALEQKEVEDPNAYLQQKGNEKMPGDLLVVLISVLVGIVMGPWIYGSYILLALNRKKGWKAVAKEAWNKFLTILCIGFLNGIIFMGAFVLAIALFFVHPALGGLGFIAWLIFLGILAPRLNLASIVALIENKEAMTAWKLTYKVTKGYWWKIVGNGIVFCLLAVLVAIAAVIVFGIISAVFSAIDPLFGMIILAFCITFVQQCITACGITFATKLTETILANPRKS